MDGSQYNSDSSGKSSDPQAAILADMSAKLEGITRLEKKLEEVTTQFSGELDFLKTEVTNLYKARKQDGAELTKLQSSIKQVSEDLANNVEVRTKFQDILSLSIFLNL